MGHLHGMQMEVGIMNTNTPTATLLESFERLSKLLDELAYVVNSYKQKRDEMEMAEKCYKDEVRELKRRINIIEKTSKKKPSFEVYCDIENFYV